MVVTLHFLPNLVWFVLRCSGHDNSGYLIKLRVFNPVTTPNHWHYPHLNVVWFIDVSENLGFAKPSYVMLRRIRASFWFGFLFVLLSYVECAPTCSWNLVFLRSVSCPVDNKIIMYLTMTKILRTSAWLFCTVDGSITNSITNNVSLDNFNKFMASVGWFVTLLTGSC